MKALLLAGTIVIGAPSVTTIDFNKTTGEGEPEFDLEALLEKIKDEELETKEVTIISFEGYDDDEKERVGDALWNKCENSLLLLEKVDDKLIVRNFDEGKYEDLANGSELPLARFTPITVEPAAEVAATEESEATV